jgi:peptidoglycan/xylan/chitin deacetylase (PgdA/CDA1 family)
MTRRVLLTAGGLTLLGGCTTPQAQRLTAVAQTRTVRSRLSGGTVPPADPPNSEPHPGPGIVGRSAGAGASGSPGNAGGGRHTLDGRPLYYVHDGAKAIALTIDDGPDRIYTPQVLSLLARYQVTATFSMIGIQAAAEPAVARDVAAAGHLISNHTWRHLNLAWLWPTAVADEMDRATDAIHRATGDAPAMFRAPYGAWSGTVLAHCQRTGLTPLAWSVDPRDWSRPGVPAIVANIMRNTKTGSIILEHDGGGNRSQTVAALKIVIPRLLDAGYHFVTP